VFEADERRIEEQLGFKDIDSSRTTKEKGEEAKQGRKQSKSPASKKSGEGRARSVPDAEDTTEVAYDEAGEDNDPTLLDMDPIVEELGSLSGTLRTGLDEQFHALESAGEEDEHIIRIKAAVLERITNHALSPVAHLQTQYATLHALLAATITAGESNSLLLLGSRGSGKSLLVSHALADLRRSHGDDFHVVRLDGFFQTDDKLALREIWRQLNREMAISEDETGEVSSYADTMASLLSLLSHPDELADEDAMVLDHEDTPAEGGAGNRTAKSVILVLDEFDLFTTHPRQTLLYNLFDIAQARKAPIAVIGCSTRMDVVDCLEKRVKSRFSHRWLHVPAAKTLAAFEEAVSEILVMDVEGKGALGVAGDDLEWRERWNAFVKVCSFLHQRQCSKCSEEILTRGRL
jgi:origin recognition complex subunit 4